MSPSSRIVPVSEVMTSRVHTAEPHQGLDEVWRMLRQYRCHHLPIVEDGRAVGMISTRDLIRIARRMGSKSLSDEVYADQTIREVMSTDLETIHIDEPVDVAIDRIGLGDLHALVVLDDDDGLAGIVTNHDLLHYLID